MRIIDQLHKSSAHATGFDPACPKCCADLNAVITHLELCAAENEKDAKAGERWEWEFRPMCSEARAVAGEQRRMLKILYQHQKAAGWKK